MTDAQDTIDTIEPFVATWRAELSGQVSVSASGVQDRLLDLWGELSEGEQRAEVERWITETLGRHLYEVADIEKRLETLVELSGTAGTSAG